MLGQEPSIQKSVPHWADLLPTGLTRCLNGGNLPVLEYNRALLSMLGYSAAEFEKQTANGFLSLLHPEDRGAFFNRLQDGFGPKTTVQAQYRLLCADGTYRWVLDQSVLLDGDGAHAPFYSVLMDITSCREQYEDMRLTLDLHQIVLDQTTDILFRWDLLEDKIVYSPNWEKKFGYAPVTEGLPFSASLLSHIHPEDVPVLQELFARAKEGAPYLSSELRVETAGRRYIWCRIRGTNQFAPDGTPLRTVGIISDIDEEKRTLEGLRSQAERDALTGLYDRRAIRLLTEKHLLNHTAGESFALMMVDVDNFKLVNDTLGHLYGDAVLSDLAEELKRSIRAGDLAGRIGGDEFVVFLKGLSGSGFAIKKAEQLLSRVKLLFQIEDLPEQLSVSIGIALFPQDGGDFQSLYQSADKALYQAKSLGKNRCVLYSQELDLKGPDEARSSLGAAIDSEQKSSGFTNQLLEYAFHTLYTTEDLEKALPLILEIAGRQFDVSRAYIFENSDDDTYCCNTFEWCQEGVEPQQQNLQHLPYTELGNYKDSFNENGIFYCRDTGRLPAEQKEILEPQGIRSMLHCAIRENGKFKGYVGFDECTGLRLWTQEEVSVLHLLAELLSTFLLKKRAQDRDREKSRRMEEMLDRQNAYIYAIDRESYELLYLNQKTLRLDPAAHTGAKCFEAFYQRSAPCERCPAAAPDTEDLELYNPQYKVWTAAGATSIEWGGRNAYLLSCYDITAYKQPPGGA